MTETFRAQNGEDRWLASYFGEKRSGFFVDVGAYDGVDLSNSFHFEQIGWKGILVEPDPDRAAHCKVHRPHSKTYQCAAVGSDDIATISFHKAAAGVYSTTSMTPEHARRLEGMGCRTEELTVPARTLDSILTEANAPAVDFVSIDVEGAEMSVLQGFDIRRWRPDIVIVESNSKLRAAEIRDYFVGHGYAYWHSIDVNDFYRRLDQGRLTTWIVDRSRYAIHRIARRWARTVTRLKRSWNKRFSN